MKNIIVTGATGLVGKRIIKLLLAKGYSVTALTRNSEKASSLLPPEVNLVEWDFKSVSGTLISEMGRADSVIHLAGENVLAKRWNEQHKKSIYNSRVKSTAFLAEAIEENPHRPESFISASAVGYYGTVGGLPVNENSPWGNDFLSAVTKDWENASAPLEKPGIRRVFIRTGIVLDRNEGALAKMITPFRFFVGGPLGSGLQPFPWIHIDDLARLYIYAVDNNSMSGAYNASAPENINMMQFCRELGSVMNRPSFFKVPGFILKLLYGEGAEILLKGIPVVPERTLESGFEFSYSDVKMALANLIKDYSNQETIS